jgi:ferredoxin
MARELDELLFELIEVAAQVKKSSRHYKSIQCGKCAQGCPQGALQESD